MPLSGPDAVVPEPFRGIYGMPQFLTVPCADLAGSTDFWVRGLGFIDLFCVPGQVVYLRRTAARHRGDHARAHPSDLHGREAVRQHQRGSPQPRLDGHPGTERPAGYRLYTDADLQRLEDRLATMAEAHELAERHREVFGNFFPITHQMQVCLGRMFEADPGFAAHYDGIRDGLASHLAVTASQ